MTLNFFVLVLLNFSVIWMQRQEEYSKSVIELTCGINLVIVLEEILSCNWYIYIYIYVTFDEVTGEWRNLHNELLNDLYSLPNIVRVVKSRRMRWAGHVARMGDDRGVHRVLVGKPEGKSHWGDQDVDGRIILRWIFRKLEGVVETEWSWLRIGRVGGHLWVR